MIIKNSVGTERNVNILFVFLKDDKKYIVYEDYNTGNVYGGKKEGNNLKALNEEEYNLLNKIFLKML